MTPTDLRPTWTPLLRTLALPVALAATVALTSCGASTSPGAASPQTSGVTSAPTGSGTPARQPVNAADVSFATMMIPAGDQAVAMTDLALKQATNVKVKALAQKIKKAEVPEIARMSGWFTSAGSPVPGAGAHDMSGMPGMAHPDMMSAKEMTDLGKATGSAFDRMWLQMMVRHHKGALAMARTELAKGSSPDGKEVAQSIIDRQPAEITAMTSILTSPPKS